MWEPRPLTTLWAFMAFYRDSFTFFLPFQRKERWDGKRKSKQIAVVTTRWQDVDGQYNSLCATLSANDKWILRYDTKINIDKIERNKKGNNPTITRHHKYTESDLDTDGRKPKEWIDRVRMSWENSLEEENISAYQQKH
jgi:hypothetical protein